jgi:hypothetical protein
MPATASWDNEWLATAILWRKAPIVSSCITYCSKTNLPGDSKWLPGETIGRAAGCPLNGFIAGGGFLSGKADT